MLKRGTSMKIFNLLIKIIPTKFFDLVAVERFLNETERKGYKLKTIFFDCVAVFYKSEQTEGKLFVLPLTSNPANSSLKRVQLKEKGFVYQTKYCFFAKVFRNKEYDGDFYSAYKDDFERELKKLGVLSLLKTAVLVVGFVFVCFMLFDSLMEYGFYILQYQNLASLVVSQSALYFWGFVLLVYYLYMCSCIFSEISSRVQNGQKRSKHLSITLFVLNLLCMIAALWSLPAIIIPIIEFYN